MQLIELFDAHDQLLSQTLHLLLKISVRKRDPRCPLIITIIVIILLLSAIYDGLFRFLHDDVFNFICVDNQVELLKRLQALLNR